MNKAGLGIRNTNHHNTGRPGGSGRADNPPAVIVGLDTMQGLQAARILAGHNIPVYGVAERLNHACTKTNVCEEVIFAPTAEAGLVGHLQDLGRRLGEKAVLFPCEDSIVLVVSRHRKELEAWYHILLPAAEVVETLMDKVGFYTYAREHGFPIPPTHILRGEDGLDGIIGNLRFPCVLKPHDSAARNWEHQTIYKAFKVHDAAELESLHARYRQWTDCFIVQEWIEGGDSDLYSCNCYFNRASEPLAVFVARKLRQWPPETGISCLGEECRNETVLAETLRLFQNVGYHGLGYVEMKQDRRTGEYFIVEPNIGRPTGRSAIAEAGGVELLYTAYCDALGRPLPEERQQRYHGVKWMHVRKDLQSAFHYWRRGELTLGEWLQSVRGRKAFALASWRDPAPFLRDGFDAVSVLFSARKLKRRVYTDPQEKDGGLPARS